MLFFVGILLLVGIPVAWASGDIPSTSAWFFVLLWLFGLLALGGRLAQMRQHR